MYCTADRTVLQVNVVVRGFYTAGGTGKQTWQNAWADSPAW